MFLSLNPLEAERQHKPRAFFVSHIESITSGQNLSLNSERTPPVKAGKSIERPLSGAERAVATVA
jgi:hypothetical protein